MMFHFLCNYLFLPFQIQSKLLNPKAAKNYIFVYLIRTNHLPLHCDQPHTFQNQYYIIDSLLNIMALKISLRIFHLEILNNLSSKIFALHRIFRNSFNKLFEDCLDTTERQMFSISMSFICIPECHHRQPFVEQLSFATNSKRICHYIVLDII